MLFDLEDYATSIVGCRDPKALNYSASANVDCEGCCRYETEQIIQEATTDGTTPISRECCSELNKNGADEGWSQWFIKEDLTGVVRCIRSSNWDYFYNRS